MKYFSMLLILVSISIGQQKSENQRYQIFNLNEIDHVSYRVLLDTQTGLTWALIKDSTIDSFPVWKPMLFVREYELYKDDTIKVSFTPKQPIKLKK